MGFLPRWYNQMTSLLSMGNTVRLVSSWFVTLLWIVKYRKTSTYFELNQHVPMRMFSSV